MFGLADTENTDVSHQLTKPCVFWLCLKIHFTCGFCLSLLPHLQDYSPFCSVISQIHSLLRAFAPLSSLPRNHCRGSTWKALFWINRCLASQFQRVFSEGFSTGLDNQDFPKLTACTFCFLKQNPQGLVFGESTKCIWGLLCFYDSSLKDRTLKFAYQMEVSNFMH